MAVTASLPAFLRRMASEPFVWGQFDCCLMIADWWLANHGVDPAGEFRGAYSTQAECGDLMRQHGGLPRLIARKARAVGAPRTDDPQPGDFAVLRTSDAWHGAIRTPSARWAVKELGRFTAVRTGVRVVAAWKI